MVILVALALIPEAATMIPGILTSLDTWSLLRLRTEVPVSSLPRVTWISWSSSSGLRGLVTLTGETNLYLEGLFCEKLKAVWAEYEFNSESNGINLVKYVHRV